MKQKMPKKTKKVANEDPVLGAMRRDGIISVDHFHSTDCFQCKAFLMDHRPMIPPHDHDRMQCQSCLSLFLAGSSGKVQCRHPEPKPIVIGIPFTLYVAWTLSLIIMGAVMFAVGYGPKWAQ